MHSWILTLAIAASLSPMAKSKYSAANPALELTLDAGRNHLDRRCFSLAFSPRNFWLEIPSAKPQGVPRRIEFSDSVMDGRWYAAYVSDSVGGPAIRLAQWKLAPNDSLEVIIPTINWAVGARLILTSKGDTLSGTARAYLDTPSRPRPTALVVAVRLPCNTSH